MSLELYLDAACTERVPEELLLLGSEALGAAQGNYTQFTLPIDCSFLELVHFTYGVETVVAKTDYSITDTTLTVAPEVMVDSSSSLLLAQSNSLHRKLVSSGNLGSKTIYIPVYLKRAQGVTAITDICAYSSTVYLPLRTYQGPLTTSLISGYLNIEPIDSSLVGGVNLTNYLVFVNDKYIGLVTSVIVISTGIYRLKLNSTTLITITDTDIVTFSQKDYSFIAPYSGATAVAVLQLPTIDDASPIATFFMQVSGYIMSPSVTVTEYFRRLRIAYTVV